MCVNRNRSIASTLSGCRTFSNWSTAALTFIFSEAGLADWRVLDRTSIYGRYERPDELHRDGVSESIWLLHIRSVQLLRVATGGAREALLSRRAKRGRGGTST